MGKRIILGLTTFFSLSIFRVQLLFFYPMGTFVLFSRVQSKSCKTYDWQIELSNLRVRPCSCKDYPQITFKSWFLQTLIAYFNNFIELVIEQSDFYCFDFYQIHYLMNFCKLLFFTFIISFLLSFHNEFQLWFIKKVAPYFSKPIALNFLVCAFKGFEWFLYFPLRHCIVSFFCLFHDLSNESFILHLSSVDRLFCNRSHLQIDD